MVLRVNWRNFLLHMIDWFDYSDLVNMWWLVLSYEIGNNGGSDHVWKASSDSGGMFPPGHIIDYYDETKDYETSKKMYHEYLLQHENEMDLSYAVSDIYRHLVALMKRHCNVCIIYTEAETWICDAFCEFIKDKFAIDVIDLDHLFKHGWIHGFYLDRDLIWEKSAEVELASELLSINDKLRTSSGRAELAAKMTKKDKVKKLKDLGIKVRANDNIDQLLYEAWIQADV